MRQVRQAAFAPLRIVASGICCAVGYHAEAASCALRAGMDNFAESEFVASDGSPLRVAKLLDEDSWGPQRLAVWGRYAISECLEQIPQQEHASTPWLLLHAATEQPGNHQQPFPETAMLRLLTDQLEMPLPQHSRLISGGRAGIAHVLEVAQQLLLSRQAKKVIVAGLDSYLSAPIISHYLQQERLLVPGNSDGFIPGEAAAAVVVELSEAITSNDLQAHICGVGYGQEPGRPDGSVPSRAQGLSHAIREAMQHAGIDANALEFRISDQNGEAFFAREAANAITRIAQVGGTIPQVLTTADCIGEVGAATGPLMLAWLHRWLPHPDGPGRCGLIHLANDDGGRAAAIIRYQH